jgi:hypothetical protein
MKNSKLLPVLTIDQVVKMAPELNAWAEMAARAYGLYSGINDAIKKSREKHGSVAHHASEIRQEMSSAVISSGTECTASLHIPDCSQDVTNFLIVTQICR